MKQITDNEFISVIGEELFEKCKTQFSGRQYYFRKKIEPIKFENKADKAEFIHNAVTTSGMTFEEISRKLNISLKYVKKLYYLHTSDMRKLQKR